MSAQRWRSRARNWFCSLRISQNWREPTFNCWKLFWYDLNRGIGNSACSRSVIAVTTGYYESAVETVQARTDLVVTMDLAGTGQNRVITQKDMARFAARYLNAMRLPEQVLQAWYHEVRSEPDTASPSLPSYCEELSISQYAIALLIVPMVSASIPLRRRRSTECLPSTPQRSNIGRARSTHVTYSIMLSNIF